MKIVIIVGARPQFVKAAVVSRALKAVGGIQQIFLHTGQHYDSFMSDVFFEELDIPAIDYNLRVGSGSHAAQTGRMLEGIESILLETRPDWVLVFGDTNSTLAGALATAKLQLPLAHVEAGLRSYTKHPEEVNRVCTDRLSDLLFAPTAQAVENLEAEGICKSKIRLVGDVMYDAALHFAAKAERHCGLLKRLGLTSKQYVLATVHRAQNTDDPTALHAIFDGFRAIAEEVPVILPLHPRARKMLMQSKSLDVYSHHIRLIEPVGYLEMILLEKHARLIATDSGGVQREAFFFNVPCVTLRTETEWTELVVAGASRLISPTSAACVESALRDALQSFEVPLLRLYGDGSSARSIADALVTLSLDAQNSGSVEVPQEVG
jgi:UDP-GlcNAc3NAcA epimerase